MPGPTSTVRAAVEQPDLAAIIQIWQAVSGELVLERLLRAVVRTALEHSAAERALLLVPRGCEMRIQAEAVSSAGGVTVRTEEQAPDSVPISLVDSVAGSGEPVFIPDAAAHHPFSNDHYLVSRQVGSIICLPLLRSAELVAVLYLESNAPNVFTLGRVQNSKLLVAAAAVSLENSRLYEEAQQRETERKVTEEQLRRTAGYLADAQKLAHVGAWSSDDKTKPLFWSEEVFRIFGFDPQQGLPRWDQPLERIHPEDRARFWQAFQKTIQEKVDVELEYRVMVPDGTVHYVHSVAHPVVDANGDLVEAVGTIIDITERKHAEQSLRRSEAYLTEAQRLSHTGSWAYDVVGGGYVYMSEECFRIFEIDPREGSALNRAEISRFIHPDDWERVRTEFDMAVRDKAGISSEFRIVLPSGNVKHVHAIRHPVINEAGEVVELFGTVVDITERKQAEEVVRQSENQLRQVIETIPVMAFTTLPDGSTEFVNRGWLEYTGATKERADLYTLNTIHPEDREGQIARWRASLASGEPFENEARHRGADGRYRWFLARSVPLRDEHGKVVKWFETLTDINDRRKAEERVRNENVALREEIDNTSMFEDVVGASPALRCLLAAVSKVAPVDATVLLTGETGTGKELIARAIHKRSPRSAKPFICVNCAAIPQSLIASELFGHEKGAFTGALQRRLGRFELADGGTIFLDEVGELPPETQIALLRVLQEREFERVGGIRPIRSEARIIAATNRDLEAAIATGTFRSDLFYRLSVFPIRVPPLRERREDISLLVEYFIDRFARKANKHITRIQKKTLELLQSFSWPGNVRELRNLVERAVIICEGDTLTVDESWLSVTAPQFGAASESPARKSAAEERELIQRALSEAQGKVAGASGAAAKLGIPPSTLESKIRLLGIDKYRYRKNSAAG